MAVDSASKYSTLGAANAALEIPLGGFGSIGFQIGGTWTGTITFEGTIDHGTWQTLNVAKTNSTTQVTSTTANGVWVGSVAGLRGARARMSSYGSGTAQVQVLVAGASAAGSSAGGGGGGDVNLTEVGGASIALGQALMAASLPVVIASDQSAIPVSGSFSSSAVGPTGDPVPADADFVGFSDPTGDLTGLAASNLDYDTGGGTVPQTVMGLALPGAGGPVAGGTATNPVRIDPTGSTTQPVTLAAAIPAGTNNIGDVDVLSLPATPAGTNLIGRVSASDETSTIYNGTTALTPKFAVIAASSSGDNTLVAGVVSKKLRVLNYTLIANAAVNAKFQSSTGGDISGLLYLAANTGASPAYAPTGQFETVAGEDLQLNLSGAVAVGGHLSYIEV